MKEQFDRRLVEKIKDSFENHEESFDPKEWEKFSDAYFDKKKPKPIWVWATLISGIAASLVIGFLIWPSIEETSLEEYVSYDQEFPMPRQDTPDIEAPIVEDGIDDNVPEREQEQRTVIPDRRQDPIAPTAKESFAIDPSPVSIASASISEEFRQEIGLSRTIAINDQTLGKLELPTLKKLEMARVLERESTPVTEEETLTLQHNIAVTTEPLKEEEAQKIINTWAMADLPAQEEKKKGDPGVKWGLVMAPQAASNTTMGLNLGGGVMSEISLSKRLKLDVGVTFARQSLVPGQGQNVAMIMDSAPAEAGADHMQYASFAIPNRASPLMAANMISPVSPTYELNFANLDIPINLKYKVMDNPQSGLYIISGLSSMIYLSQSTSETFDISYVGIGQANAFSANQVQTFSTEVTAQDGENTVDLGRMLNLSFGYEYKLSNGTFLSVEPFYKLPIGNMTFADQQFSIGGVNFRMNFQFKR